MTKDVSITIEGVLLGSEESPILLTTSGTYHFNNERHNIRYEEMAEDGTSVIKNTIKISQTQIEMMKKGVAFSQMSFDLNHATAADYHTPYGNLIFEVRTSGIILEEQPDLFEVTLEYSLFANEELVSEHRTILRVIPLS